MQKKSLFLTFAIQTIASAYTVSIDEQLYNFVVEFKEMSPALFNLQKTWIELQLLLDKGALFSKAEVDINTQHRSTGVTMLYCATRTGATQTAIRLLQEGANPNLHDFVLGNTPLHAAAEKGYENLIHSLSEHRAKIDSINFEGQTPLHKAVLANQTACVQALLQAKAQKNIRDRYGKKAIDYALARGYDAIIELLS